MKGLTSLEWQELISYFLDSSYQPFLLIYPTLWAFAILQRLFQEL